MWPSTSLWDSRPRGSWEAVTRATAPSRRGGSHAEYATPMGDQRGRGAAVTCVFPAGCSWHGEGSRRRGRGARQSHLKHPCPRSQRREGRAWRGRGARQSHVGRLCLRHQSLSASSSGATSASRSAVASSRAAPVAARTSCLQMKGTASASVVARAASMRTLKAAESR